MECVVPACVTFTVDVVGQAIDSDPLELLDATEPLADVGGTDPDPLPLPLDPLSELFEVLELLEVELLEGSSGGITPNSPPIGQP